MKNMNSMKILGVLLVFILSGCSNNGSEYQEYMTIVNKVIETENELLQYDAIFIEVQNEENHLYETIIKEGENAISDVEDYIEEASVTISKGKNLIINDQKTVQNMQTELDKAEHYLDALSSRKDGELQRKLHQLYNQRLDQYGRVLMKCDDFLNKKQALYDSLTSGEPLKNVSGIVDEINLFSADMESEILTFNQLTDEYIKLKSSS